MKIFARNFKHIGVLGEAIIPILQLLINRFHKKDLLEEYNLDNVLKYEYYPLQDYLDLLEKFHSSYNNNSQIFKMLGKEIFKDIKKKLPAIYNFESALSSLDGLYHRNHKNYANSEIGYYKFEKINDKKYHIISNTPYLCPMELGIIEGIKDIYNVNANIIHQSESCRMQEDDICVYAIILF